MIPLRRLIRLGSRTADQRRSLMAFAKDYRPDNTESEFLECWEKLMYVLGEAAPDAALTGLLSFLVDADKTTSATICMNLECSVSFSLNAAIVCVDAHDGDVLCCAAHKMRSELASLCAAYDTQNV